MNGVISLRTHTAASVFAVSALLWFLACAPGHAAAATVATARTQELLPPGQNTCQAITVTSIDPHVYGGSLESFDVTVTDSSYLGILATVGQTSVPLQYMTRWAGSPSGLMIHVDTQATPVNVSLPVTLTLISGLPGQPVCLSTVSFSVTGTGIAAATPAPISGNISGGSPVAVPPSPGTGTGSSNMSSSGTGKTPSGSSANPSMSGVGVGTAYTGALVAGGSPITGLGKIGNICKGSNADRLWLVLLVLYVVLAAVVVFADIWFLEESVLGMTASILVPLILLLAFWYFSAACRAAPWIPVVACVIAIVALFLAFREEETIIMLPERISS